MVYDRLGADFTAFDLERQYYPLWKYPFDSKTLVEFFRENFGPVKRAFDSLDENSGRSLRAELEEIFEAHNIATDGTTEIKGEYLNVSAIRK